MAKWKLLFVVSLMTSLSFVGVNAFDTYSPTVTSDKEDYSPGQTAIIEGYGWTKDDFVDVHLEEDPAHDHHHEYHDTKVDENGYWRIEYPIEDRHLGVKFTVIVDGKQSGDQATTTFTDGNLTLQATGLPSNTPVAIYHSYTAAGSGSVGSSTTFNAGTPHTGVAFQNNTDLYFKYDKTVTVANVVYTLENVTALASTGNNNPSPFNLSISTNPDYDYQFKTNQNVILTAKYSILQHPTNLSVVSSTGSYGGLVDISATLTSDNSGLSGKQISFSLNGNSVGTALTNSAGVATLNNVDLTGLNAGTYSSAITASYSEEPNYKGSNATASLVIEKASATISLGNLTYTFDGTEQAALVTTSPAGLSGLVINYKPDNTDDGSYTISVPINAGTYEVRATLNNANYESVAATGTLQINKAEQTISWANPSSIEYGTPLSDAQLNATLTFGDGALTYAPEAGVLLNAGTHELEVTAAETNNFNAAKATVSIEVTKATPSVSLVIGGPYTYDGNAVSVSSATVTGVGGVSLGVATVSYEQNGVGILSPVNAGIYNVRASFAGNTNYNEAETTGALEIEKAQATLTLSNLTGHTYDGTPKNAVVSTDPADLSGVTITNNGQTNSGTYSIAASLNNPNYDAEPVAGQLIINNATLTITADDQSRIYGEQNPVFTGSVVSGGVQDETFIVTASSNAVSGSDVGQYDITPSVMGATLINYDIIATKGTLTITKRPITIAAEAGQNKVFGESDPASYTYRLSPGSLTDNFHLTGSLTRDAGEDVGTYAIKQGSLVATANYALTYEGADFVISKRDVTVTADAKSKTYGDDDPELTYVVTSGSVVNGDAFSGVLRRAEGENIGEYAINLGTLSLGDNYNLSFAGSAVLGISPKALVASIAASNKVYDGNTSATVTGSVPAEDLIGSDVVAVAVSNAVFDTKSAGTGKTVSASVSISNINYSLSNSTATTTANITPKEITGAFVAASKVYDGTTAANVTDKSLQGVIGQDDVELTNGIAAFSDKNAAIGKTVTLAGAVLDGSDKANYFLSTVSTASADISPKPASVTPVANSKVYGTSDPALSGSTSDFVAADGITATFARSAGESVGSYAISAILEPQRELSNYAITYNTAAFEITKASLSVIADDFTREYGDENPTFTGAVRGIVAGDVIIASYGTPATKASAVGDYPIEPTLTGDALSNYEVSSTNGTLTISKASLSVSANDKSRIYGIVNPELDGVLSGVKNEDNISASYTTEATADSNVGEYVISTSLQDPDDKLGNYVVTIANAKLTITQAPATIALAGLSKVYNGTEQEAEVTTSPAGLSVTVTYAGGTALPKTAGSYAVLAVLNNSNYSADNGTGTLVITQKEVTATLVNTGKVYDGTTTATGTTATLEGVISPDDVTTTVTDAAYSAAAAGERTVTATVVLAGADKANYTLKAVMPVNATISPKELTATIAAQDKVYDGNADASATGSVADVIAGDEVLVTVSNAKFGDKNVGNDKSVTAGVAISNSNYVLTSGQASTTASITKAPLTITAPSMNKYCGTVDPMTGYASTVVGAVAGEVIATSYSFSGTDVIPSSTDSQLSNYAVDYNNGTLTVNAVSLEQNNSNNPRSINEDVIITVTVEDGSALLAGVSLKLMINGSERETAVSNENGIATFNIGKLAANVYGVKIVAGDGCSESSLAYMPVYDPDGGFVTGGGWINSRVQPGVEYMHTAGKANFGFNAKYKKGKNEVDQVDGNTTFHLNAGNMDFKSSSHTAMSLVIAKHKATYTGEGTINGISGYGFRVIAVDGDLKDSGNPDQFRIKIWVKNSGQVVYDNQYGIAENEEPTGDNTILGGGSIVIHENKALTASNGKKQEVAGQVNGLSTARFDNYPNAFSDQTTIRFAFDAEQSFSLEVYDIRGALVKKVATGKAEAGQVYEYELDARNLAEGVYFARLAAGSKIQTIKMLLKK
ncbi:MBG domain-containing protein [uncultured Pontibacter sp.]|uniref:MBG domain-containing protein n=1 Tax=uncultured Pontibacter sp. TaxID=453356 RepID=UPI00262F908F|nr:MBG domain-containing protein [uncultured Pontibacter sp.]